MNHLNILITHPNFPAQFKHLARKLAENPQNTVYFLTKHRNNKSIPNVSVAVYKPKLSPNKETHDFAKKTEEFVIEGQAVESGIQELQKKTGFLPDLIIGHVGWGSLMYVREILPKVPVIGYFEWFYNSNNFEKGYWKSERAAQQSKMRLRTMNTANLISLGVCDKRVSPMEWQRNGFPKPYHDSIKVIHEGIDTEKFCMFEKSGLELPEKNISLPKEAKIITYVSRGLEPYRGFPQFMNAAREILEKRSDIYFVVVGADRCYYGRKPDKGTWYEKEVEKGYDHEHILFTGTLPEPKYIEVLKSSSLHVYLTRPFVLSWSMLEVMSTGKCLVASNTAPVREVVEDGFNGVLADFNDSHDIADKILSVIDNEGERRRLGINARNTILNRFEVNDCLDKWLDFIDK